MQSGSRNETNESKSTLNEIGENGTKRKELEHRETIEATGCGKIRIRTGETYMEEDRRMTGGRILRALIK